MASSLVAIHDRLKRRHRLRVLIEREVASGLGFDVFRLQRMLGSGEVLPVVAEAIIRQHGLLKKCGIHPASLNAFLQELNQRYHACNAYHNTVHVADMLQTLHVFVSNLIRITPTPEELLLLFLAAACHDVDHPGLSNAFYTKALNELNGAGGAASDAVRKAAEYAQDAEVAGAGANEWHHAQLGWELVNKYGLLNAFSAAAKAEAESLFKSVILATDMAKHEGVLGAATTAAANPTAADSRTAILAGLLHIADVFNPCRPAQVALRLGNGVSLEMLSQGDVEMKVFGVIVNTVCSTRTIHTPDGQKWFVNTFIPTTLDCLQLFSPAIAAQAREQLQLNLEMWARLKQAGMVLPLADAARTVEQFVQEVQQISRNAEQQQQQQDPQVVLSHTAEAEQLGCGVEAEVVLVSRSGSLSAKRV